MEDRGRGGELRSRGWWIFNVSVPPEVTAADSRSGVIEKDAGLW